MKKFLVILIALFFATKIYSQTITVTTWYVVPPTSGCNGIWAIDATTWPCFTGGCTYMFPTPFGCTPSVPTCDSIVADTLYIPLCSLPCYIAASCGPVALVCSILPPVTTSINQTNQQEIKTIFSNNTLSIENLISDDFIEIYDVPGRLIISKKSSGTNEEIDFSLLSRQVYILLVKNKANETIYSKKIAW